MGKKIAIGILIVIILVLFVLLTSEPAEESLEVGKPTPTPASEVEQIKIQLEDVENKIKELPELEKDIFTKCMEGKEGTAKNIRTCEESTQKQIFTLSQEMINLKRSLQEKLEELQ